MYLRAQLRSKMLNKRYHYWHEHSFAMRIWLVWIGRWQNVCALALIAPHSMVYFALKTVSYVLGLRPNWQQLHQLSNWLFPEHIYTWWIADNGQTKGNELLGLMHGWADDYNETPIYCTHSKCNGIKWEPDIFRFFLFFFVECYTFKRL